MCLNRDSCLINFVNPSTPRWYENISISRTVQLMHVFQLYVTHTEIFASARHSHSGLLSFQYPTETSGINMRTDKRKQAKKNAETGGFRQASKTRANKQKRARVSSEVNSLDLFVSSEKCQRALRQFDNKTNSPD